MTISGKVEAREFFIYARDLHPHRWAIVRGPKQHTNHSSCKIASASIVISPMLPTTTPPLSNVLFQLTPKLWRLIVAVR